LSLEVFALDVQPHPFLNPNNEAHTEPTACDSIANMDWQFDLAWSFQSHGASPH
jgi:hypothetical protein